VPSNWPETLWHVDIDIAIGLVVAIEEDDRGLAFGKDVVRDIVPEA